MSTMWVSRYLSGQHHRLVAATLIRTHNGFFTFKIEDEMISTSFFGSLCGHIIGPWFVCVEGWLSVLMLVCGVFASRAFFA